MRSCVFDPMMMLSSQLKALGYAKPRAATSTAAVTVTPGRQTVTNLSDASLSLMIRDLLRLSEIPSVMATAP